ncbi:MAG: HEAT repeat domain-containing protein [Symploca sp. SIO2B6]|nr:HEAT repeat domain-containing protein [Symploca sp. SIO2B6]
MVKHTRVWLVATVILKVSLLVLAMCLFASSNSWAQPSPNTNVAPLIKKLTDDDFRIRHDAAEAVVKIGSQAVPALIEALHNDDRQVRWRAASALGQIGAEAAPAVPELIARLQDEDEYVRRISVYALGEIGAEAAPAVPQLIEALQDKDRNLRVISAYALGKIGSEASPAVPYLIEALQDESTEIRFSAATALGRIGSQALSRIPVLTKTLVPVLTKALQDGNKYVRQSAADALGRFGAEASTAVPTLITALQDENKYLRSKAATALGKIGAEAKPSVPVLITVLEDKQTEVRQNAAIGLGEIAGTFQDNAKKLSRKELEQDIANLEKALEIVENPSYNFTPEDIVVIRRPLLALKAEKETRLFDRTLEWIVEHRWFLGITSYVTFVPLLWLTFLWLRPLWLLGINNALKPYTDVPLPFIGISVPIRFALFVGFFHYHPRVLDAWVAEHLSAVQEEFQEKDTVSDRKVYIPVPVILDGETIPQFTSSVLQSKFKKQRFCLLIWGEGGAGKTSLACQIAKWAFSEQETTRLCQHLMLPVLIEEELECEAIEDEQPLIAAIRGQLQDLANEKEPISGELLERLLRQRRILVIVDHLSEMSETTRKAIRPELPNFCINALVVTSRAEETLGKVTKTTLKPMRIEGNRLSSFMEAYLRQRGKRDYFTDTEFFNACSRLSMMVGTRDITVLLAKLYAEQLINAKDRTAASASANDTLPNNIPDLMLSYLNELNRAVTGDNFEVESDGDRSALALWDNHLASTTVHQDAKIIAWECLQSNYRPTSSKRSDVLAALEGDDAQMRLKYLEERLRLIQTIGPALDQIRFALDPLAEYLAGLHLVELYGKNQGQWRKFLDRAKAMPGAPTAIQGFLLAVLDCTWAKGEEFGVPSFVVKELEKRNSKVLLN